MFPYFLSAEVQIIAPSQTLDFTAVEKKSVFYAKLLLNHNVNKPCVKITLIWFQFICHRSFTLFKCCGPFIK